MEENTINEGMKRIRKDYDDSKQLTVEDLNKLNSKKRKYMIKVPKQ